MYLWEMLTVLLYYYFFKFREPKKDLSFRNNLIKSADAVVQVSCRSLCYSIM